MRQKDERHLAGGVAVDDPISDFLSHGYGELLGWIAGRAPAGADFEAAIQEALMQAWMRPPGEIDSLGGWLRTVALNRIRSDLRRRDAEARAIGRLQVEELLKGHDGVVSEIDWDQVLGELSNGQREAVVLHYFEDRSVEEVAAAVGVSTGTVKTQLHRARATGERVVDRPHPLPSRWRDDFAWHIDTEVVRALAAELIDGLGFVAGTVENEADAWELFDHVVCLVVDEETLRYRLATRTTNAFGKDPVELEMAVAANRGASDRCRTYGATVIDATQPVDAVVRDLLAAVVK